MEDLLKRIETDLATVAKWDPIEDRTLASHGARSYQGKGRAWSFLVVGAGESIRDGTAVRLPRELGAPDLGGPLIVRLPRELAVKAWGLATRGRENV